MTTPYDATSKLQAENTALKERVVTLEKLQGIALIESLRAEVERLSKLAYIGEHQFDDNTWKHRVNELRQQLAISQLEAKRLREALLLIKCETDIHGNSLNTPTRSKALKALHSQTSTEALDAYVTEKVKKATKPLVRAIDEYMVVIACFEQELGAYFAKEQLEELPPAT